MQKILSEERSHIFVKEPEGSSEKILKYAKCTYGGIFVPSQKNKFTIYAYTIFSTYKLIELEMYNKSLTSYPNKYKILITYLLICDNCYIILFLFRTNQVPFYLHFFLLKHVICKCSLNQVVEHFTVLFNL